MPCSIILHGSHQGQTFSHLLWGRDAWDSLWLPSPLLTLVTSMWSQRKKKSHMDEENQIYNILCWYGYIKLMIDVSCCAWQHILKDTLFWNNLNSPWKILKGFTPRSLVKCSMKTVAEEEAVMWIKKMMRVLHCLSAFSRPVLWKSYNRHQRAMDRETEL